MGPIAYGMVFVGILILNNLIRYKHEDTIDKLFALDSTDENIHFRPNITFQGFMFLEHLFVCFVAKLFNFLFESYRVQKNPYDLLEYQRGTEVGSDYESVQTNQNQREKFSPSFGTYKSKRKFQNSQISQQSSNSSISESSSNSSISQQSSNENCSSKVPINYSMALGFLYFASIKISAYTQSQFSITMSVEFKALYMLIFFIINSCMLRVVKLQIPWVNIKIKFGNVKSSIYQMVLMVLICGSSLVFFPIDDLFRIAMVESNRSLRVKLQNQDLAFYILTLTIDYIFFSLLFTVKSNCPKTNCTQNVLGLLQFSAVFFAINLLINGQLLSTILFFFNYPGSFFVIFQITMIGFAQYLIFAYALLEYPSKSLLIVIGNKPSLKYLHKHLIEEPSFMFALLYGIMAVSVILYAIELAKMYKKPKNTKKKPVQIDMAEVSPIKSENTQLAD